MESPRKRRQLEQCVGTWPLRVRYRGSGDIEVGHCCVVFLRCGFDSSRWNCKGGIPCYGKHGLSTFTVSPAPCRSPPSPARYKQRRYRFKSAKPLSKTTPSSWCISIPFHTALHNSLFNWLRPNFIENYLVSQGLRCYHLPLCAAAQEFTKQPVTDGQSWKALG